MLPETHRQAQQFPSSRGGSLGNLHGSVGKTPEERRRCSRRVLATGLLSLSVAFLLLLESGALELLAETPISNPGRVLVVTAHPDDEVIFFASTISALHSSGLEVFLLCLTNGEPNPARAEWHLANCISALSTLYCNPLARASLLSGVRNPLCSRRNPRTCVGRLQPGCPSQTYHI
jgi:hypothetical protein